MGSLFSSSQKQESSGDPIKQQAFQQALPFWQQGLAGASNLFNEINANPAYGGQRVADLNPYQINSANQLGNYSQNTAGMSNAFNRAGLSNLNAGANYGKNAQSIYSLAGQDPTQSIINNAGQYANNPYISGMIDAANRDVSRSLAENDLPSMNRSYAGTGNLNSSRAGVQDAITQRGAMDRMADTSSQIRSQFFGQGLGMAQNQYNNNLSNMMSANNQLYNAGNMGSSLLNAGQNYATNNFNQGQQAGGMFQQQNQNRLNANQDFFNQSLQNRLAVLQALNGTYNGGQGWSGGPTSSTTTKNPSMASQIGAILSAFS